LLITMNKIITARAASKKKFSKGKPICRLGVCI